MALTACWTAPYLLPNREKVNWFYPGRMQFIITQRQWGTACIACPRGKDSLSGRVISYGGGCFLAVSERDGGKA